MIDNLKSPRPIILISDITDFFQLENQISNNITQEETEETQDINIELENFNGSILSENVNTQNFNPFFIKNTTYLPKKRKYAFYPPLLKQQCIDEVNIKFFIN